MSAHGVQAWRVFAAAALLALPLAAQTRLKMRWELKENVFEGPADDGRSRAVLSLQNQDAKPLPASGWAIYFNSAYTARAGSVTGGMKIEHLNGGLSRLAPLEEFRGLAPGQTVEIGYLASHLITKPMNALAGPYLVFEAEPAKGHPLDFAAQPLTRPEQLAKGPQDPVPVVTAGMLFRQNEAIRDLPDGSLPPIFPTPKRMERKTGSLLLTGSPRILAAPGLAAEREFATRLLRPFLADSGEPKARLELSLGRVPGESSAEAYELKVIPGLGIRVSGNTAAGVHLGLQSLRDLLPLQADPAVGMELPAIEVVDAPRFVHRGLHLDSARNFQPTATVLRVLDLMARYKLNVLHFHLTDDEGWRLEIPGLPELTQVGGRRGHTLDSADFLPPAFGTGPALTGGHYSRADFLAILRHAKAHHIQVLPEIEVPGHARAAVVAMEARFRRLHQAGDPQAGCYRLRDPGDRSVYLSAQLFKDNLMDPALPSTYAFIAKVVREIAAMYKEAGAPLASIHLGGDEVPGGAWEKSPACQALLRDRGWASVDELWGHFYDQVERLLRAHGLALSGWEEIALRRTRLDGRTVNIPNPRFAQRGFRAFVWNNVMGWGAEDLAYRLANGGYPVVLAPVTNFYFDLAYNKNPDEPGLTWGGSNELSDGFGFVPFDYYRNARTDRHGNPLDRSVLLGKDRLTEYGQGNIRGIQACLWSETLVRDGALDYLLLPKLLGLAERAWAADPAWAREADPVQAEGLYTTAWSTFVNTVGKRLLPRLDQEGLNWRYRIPPPGLQAEAGVVTCNQQIPGFTLRFSADGSEPTVTSPQVQGPIRTRGRIAVAGFDLKGRRGNISWVDNP